MADLLLTGVKTNQQITDDLLAQIYAKPSKTWFLALGLAVSALVLGVLFTFRTVFWGIGEWGLNRTVGWGWAIVNFVWWIGIGHAGTFISAILLLFGQKWRNSINRAAEAMTIVAILCAAFFPVIHLGRVLVSFYIFPYLNTRNLWVNFNSPLLWDVFAIATYFIVSLIFWYTGLIPDLAAIRDRFSPGLKKSVYSFLSNRWTGSGRQWRSWWILSFTLAGLATPLVISVHSIVSMDFATSIIPGWHSTIFPPYFVAGAILSGFAMVSMLLIITRKVMNLQNYITLFHIEAMNKIILVTGSLVALAYATEFFLSFISGNEYEIYVFINRMTGPYALAFWSMMLFNVIIPQLYWVKQIRVNITLSLIFAILINVGMWIERMVIVVTSLHRDFIPSNWSHFQPTLADIGLFIGSIGFFFTLFLLIIRYIPVISISEVKHIANLKNKEHGK